MRLFRDLSPVILEGVHLDSVGTDDKVVRQ